jgi:predicted acylesterase/phospholipase RssA
MKEASCMPIESKPAAQNQAAPTPGDQTSQADQLPPPKAFAEECDLVMKGGITSGVVYPLAIVEIAKAFRLRSIGGTSAGAIAAAAAAAAECGRRRAAQLPQGFDSFAALEKLPDFLRAKSASGLPTNLLAFFRPLPAVRHVFFALTASLKHKGMSARAGAALSSLLVHYWWLTLAMAAAAGYWISTLPGGMASVVYAGLIAIVSLLALVVLVVFLTARTVLRTLPLNFFGLCTGMPEEGAKHPQEPLTAWMHSYFDGLGGQDVLHPGKPLTFGDLKEHDIDLQVMTTCLTLGRPFRLPFRDDDVVKENNQFFFDEAEFRRLFPKAVVDWMVANPRTLDGDAEKRQSVDRDSLKVLPAPDDLPVVVAARMSLSFPILLGAVPLFVLDYREAATWRKQPKGTPRPKPQHCWFTDGGVGSNFPIHFFDAPLPTRPTFGLDLGHAESTTVDRVVFPKDNGDARLPYWRRLGEQPSFDSIASFVETIFSVAKDWSHEALTHSPGYRDRIGLIRLTSEEGGLNLTMPTERITRLTGYGQQAGKEFVVRFGNPARWPTGYEPHAMNWENHQSIRLRLLLGTYAESLEQLGTSFNKLVGTPADYSRFMSGNYGPKSYRFNGTGELQVLADGLHGTQAGLCRGTLDALLACTSRIQKTVSARGPGVHPAFNAPKPLPEQRLRPRI